LGWAAGALPHALPLPPHPLPRMRWTGRLTDVNMRQEESMKREPTEGQQLRLKNIHDYNIRMRKRLMQAKSKPVPTLFSMVKNWRISDMARATGLSVSACSLILRGAREPRIGTAQKIAWFLGEPLEKVAAALMLQRQRYKKEGALPRSKRQEKRGRPSQLELIERERATP